MRNSLNISPSPVRGFTLIELLVVIAIIAILAGLMLPVLAKAKQKGQSSICLNDLKQVGLAMQMFADENDDMIPRGTAGNSPRWWMEFMPYLSEGSHEKDDHNVQIFMCPSYPIPKIGRKGMDRFHFYARPLHISFGTAPHQHQGCDCDYELFHLLSAFNSSPRTRRFFFTALDSPFLLSTIRSSIL